MNPIPITDTSLALAYCRVSSREQAKDGYGLDVQAADIAEFADREGLTIAERFDDPGVSGTKPLEERPGLSAALDHAISIGAGVLVIARSDRIARDTFQALLIERTFSRAGVRVVYTVGQNTTDAVSRYQRTNDHAIAELAKQMLVKQMRDGRERKAIKHPKSRAQGGRIPFGYRRAKTKLEIDPADAEIVRRLFALVRSGKSLRATAKLLSSDDHVWHPNTVERIVKREIYKEGKPALIDGRVWKAANDALAARRRR
jgi:site-specific DNA recombinase